MTDRWYPMGVPLFSRLAHEVPEPGMLVAHDRALYRVIAVHEDHPANWTERDRNRLAQNRRTVEAVRRRRPIRDVHSVPTVLDGWDGSEEAWPNRPRGVELQPMAGGKRLHAGWPHPGWAYWYPLDEHHPVCATCGEPFPCREVDAAKEAARQMVKVEKLMAIGPGCCWHCGEPITSRQVALSFTGENLLLPGAPSPSFHQRKTGGCLYAAKEYEKKWREANPDLAETASLFSPSDA